MRRKAISLIPLLALAVLPALAQAQDRPRVRVSPRVEVQRNLRRAQLEQQIRQTEQRIQQIERRLRQRVAPRAAQARIQARGRIEPRVLRERIESRAGLVPRVRQRIESRIQTSRARLAPRMVTRPARPDGELLRQRLDGLRRPMVAPRAPRLAEPGALNQRDIRPLLRQPLRAARIRRWM